jgi:hypothetical protein
MIAVITPTLRGASRDDSGNAFQRPYPGRSMAMHGIRC